MPSSGAIYCLSANINLYILITDKVISGRTARMSTKASTPRIITLGGDHTTTLAALRSAHSRWGEISVIHFDSHIG